MLRHFGRVFRFDFMFLCPEKEKPPPEIRRFLLVAE
jgi:hypothetical protein